jgi:hypothetical protein
MSSVLDAVEPAHRAVIEEELGRRAPALLDALRSANQPTNEQSDALMDVMIRAMGEHYGPGHVPDERGVAIDNAVGAYLLTWPIHRD